MERPPLPPSHLQMEFQREIAEEESRPDEFFGLVEQAELQPKSGWQKLLHRMFPTSETFSTDDSSPPPKWRVWLDRLFPNPSVRSAQVEIQQLEEKQIETDSVENESSSLEPHMIKLQGGRDFQDILDSEKESSLFGGYEKLRLHRRQNQNLSLAGATIITVALMLLSGIEYLSALIQPNQAFLFGELLGYEIARAVSFGCGMLGPLVGFMLLQIGLNRLFIGFRERSPIDLILALTLLATSVVGFQALGSGNYLLGIGYLLAGFIGGKIIALIGKR
jgi:hypothetical protein